MFLRQLTGPALAPSASKLRVVQFVTILRELMAGKGATKHSHLKEDNRNAQKGIAEKVGQDAPSAGFLPYTVATNLEA